MKINVAFWRAPEDQPAWSRPALLVVAASSAVLYGWQATGKLEIFYAAGVRSVSMNWHNFFFAAFDPKATVTLDKLPGAFWVQALFASARQGGAGFLVMALVVLLVVPAVASVSLVTKRLGPFDTPFESTAINAGTRQLIATTLGASKLVGALEQARLGAPDLMATQTSALASPFIYATGQEVVPIGGYTGTIAEPSLARLQSMIRAGDFHLVLRSRTATDPRLVWVAQHCVRLRQTARDAPQFVSYFCGTT
jgi:hypothetical protein